MSVLWTVTSSKGTLNLEQSSVVCTVPWYGLKRYTMQYNTIQYNLLLDTVRLMILLSDQVKEK